MSPSRLPARPRLLVVDDDADILSAVGDVLEDEGYDVVTAENGAEALAHLQGDPLPQLILLDLMMPVMDGWTLLRRMREDVRLQSVPIVIMSAAGARAKSTIPDSISLLTKPLDLSVLLDTIRQTATPSN
jgi:CheY-like chemotaxis protein